MKLLKPKKIETVTEEFDITKSTKLIVDLYSKYTKYTEGEILDHLLLELLKEDEEFVQWISEQRTIKKFLQSDLIQHLTKEQQELFQNRDDEVLSDESNEEVGN